MKNNPFFPAKWIGTDSSCVSPIIYREFSIGNIESARLLITGLGYFEAKINGKTVSEDMFVPVISDYEPRDTEKFTYPLFDETTHRIYYCTYDITDLLVEGKNVLNIQLGDGWYRQTERIAEGNMSFGEELKAIYKIEAITENGNEYICSDGSEKYTQSEIIYSNLFIGEIINPNAITKDKKRVKILDDTKSLLTEQIGTPDRIIRTIEPTLIATVKTKKIFDLGENISGIVKIHTSAKAGEKISLRFAEEINEDFSLNFDSTGAAYKTADGKLQIMSDVFVADGTSRDYSPKFVWHAFRYFEIEGDFDSAKNYLNNIIDDSNKIR